MRTADGSRRQHPYPTAPARGPADANARPQRPERERFQPVATLDFSGFDALNTARPAPPPPTRSEAPGDAVPDASPTVGVEPAAAPPSATTRPAQQPEPPHRDVPASAPAGDDPFDGLDAQRGRSESARRPQGRPVPDVEPFVDDLFGDFDAEDDEAGPSVARVPSEPAGRRRRSRSVAFGRRVLGLDRPEKKPRQDRPPRGGNGDPAWLVGLDEPAPQSANDNRPTPRRGRDRSDVPLLPSAPRRPSRTTTAGADDLEMTAAPRGFTTVLWLWVARVAVAVVFLAGVNQVFVKPFRTVKPIATAVTMDIAASQQAAARYVSDYLSFLPGRGPAQLAALQNDVAGTSGAALAQWSGTGYLRVDSVLPGQVVPVDATHSVVSVAALVRTATPPPKQTAAEVATPAGAAVTGANPGPVPTGWTDLGSRWIQLTVPVQLTGIGVRVSGEGAVFAGENPQLVAEPAGAQVDQGVSTATTGVANSLLTAYASSDLSYLAAPGVSLNGLHSAAKLVSVTGWSVSLPPGSTTTGFGAGLVTWQLTGTDLLIAQPYAIALTNSQGRWYGAALSPNPAAQ